MIYILGEGTIKTAYAYSDVRSALTDCFEDDIYLGAHWADILGVDLSGKDIYNLEPLHDSDIKVKNGYLNTLLKCRKILDYSKANVDYLATKGISAYWMPYLFNPSLRRIKHAEKDIDILFVGTIHHWRRAEALLFLSDKFKVIAAQGYYGNDLDDLIARAKVVVNIHHSEYQPLAVVRLNYLIANGCNVVSEFGADPYLNSLYIRYIRMCEFDDIVKTCEKALIDPIDPSHMANLYPQDCFGASDWLRGEKCPQ